MFAKHKDILVDEKMAAEKGVLPPDESEKPWKNGVVTLAAFVVFVCALILAFIILKPFSQSHTHKFIGACGMSALALALFGAAKAKVAGQNYAVSMGITVLNGAIVCAAAYLIGWTLQNIGLED